MNNKILIYVIIFCCLTFISCKTEKGNISSNDKDYNVEVIKFMGSIRSQPYSINEKIFWSYPDEHAKILIKNIGFINDVKSIKDTTSTNFEDYNYAFLVKNGRQVDTLYSDSSLKTWILKKGKKNIYFYDKKGETAENLRHTYSFFKNCW